VEQLRLALRGARLVIGHSAVTRSSGVGLGCGTLKASGFNFFTLCHHVDQRSTRSVRWALIWPQLSQHSARAWSTFFCCGRLVLQLGPSWAVLPTGCGIAHFRSCQLP